MARRRPVRLLPDRDVMTAAPEDVILGKLWYYAEGGGDRHLRDIAGILRVTGDGVDRAEVEHWARRLGYLEIWEAVVEKPSTPRIATPGAGRAMSPAKVLPQVYEELRSLAAAKLALERPGQTLDATGLVHEAFLKLGGDRSFATRADYLKAAAVAMRRIFVDRVRARCAAKRGGGRRVELDSHQLAVQPADDFEALDAALSRLAVEHPRVAELIQLRFFGGSTLGRVRRGARRVAANGRHLVGLRPRLARRPPRNLLVSRRSSTVGPPGGTPSDTGPDVGARAARTRGEGSRGGPRRTPRPGRRRGS